MLQSINPFTGQIFAETAEISDQVLTEKINLAQKTYQFWKNTDLEKRIKLLKNLASLLKQKKETLAGLVSREMGMPFTQSQGGVEKISQICHYYADNAKEFLADKIVKTNFSESLVKKESMGVMLHVAPWNFPIYLSLRPVIPAILAGNTVLLKPSSNVPQIGQALEALFLEAGFDEGIMQTILVRSDKVERIIRDENVKLITLIGSEKAGSMVAKTAGEEVKKTVMELGGSDAFIVLKDANVEAVAPFACSARTRNNGQSCNAAKRFIVQEEIAQKFMQKVQNEFSLQKMGDPLEKDTQIGPLASPSTLEEVKSQVEESVKMGAEVLIGGHGEFAKLTTDWEKFLQNHQQGFFYPPTLLTKVTKYMPVCNQEVFAPVAPVIIVQSVEEAVMVANESRYGLGASIWTEDVNFAKTLISQLETGNVFIKSPVRSNIKLPFGGVKKSGYGREMAEEGLLELVNLKTVVVA